MSEVGEASSSSATTAASQRVPLLASEAGHSGVHYAAWRPQMETFLMRAGIEVSDYTKEIPRWKELDALVQEQRRANEEAALAHLLGGDAAVKVEAGAAAPAAASSKETETAKKIATEMMGRIRKAYGYLFQALHQDLRALVADVPQGYAYGIWAFLEKRFQNTERDNVADLWAQFVGCAQDPEELFDAYKARVDRVRGLLNHAKEQVSEGLYSHILVGKLQPRYKQAVLALKASGQLTVKAGQPIDWPSIVTFMMNQEREDQRLVADNAGERSFAARGGAGAQGRQGGNKAKQRDMSNVKCFNCQQHGHFARNCPSAKRQQEGQQWHKQKGRLRRNTGGGSESDEGQASAEQNKAFAARQVQRSTNRFEPLSSDDDEDEVKPASAGRSYAAVACAAACGVQAMVNSSQEQRPMLKRLKRASEMDKVEEKKKPMKPTAAAASAKGKAAEITRAPKQPRTPKPLDVALKTDAWGVDSMASSHCTGNKDLLYNIKKCGSMPIKVADGAIVTAMYMGSVDLRLNVVGKDKPVKVKLDGVYYHERFDANLLSWGTLRQLGWEMHSNPNETYLVTAGKNKVMASTRGRVTVLDCATTEIAYGARAARMGKVVCTSADELVRLHERLGHPGFKRLVKMCEAGITDGIGEIKMSKEELSRAEQVILDCPACARGKTGKQPLGHRGLDKGTRIGEVLHMDTAYVSIRDPKTGAKKIQWWLVVVEPYSEARWSVITYRKDEITEETVNIVKHCETMTGRKVKRIYSDGGGEFVDQHLQRYCDRTGKEFHPSPPRTPELNGIAERNVRSYKDSVRTMLAHAGLDRRSWSYAAAHQAYIWNRTRVGRTTGMTPRQALTGRTSSVLHVGVFGCDAYIHNDRTQRDTTFDFKADPGIYLGHDVNMNCAIVQRLRDGKIIRTKDVELREGSFKHAHAKKRGCEQQVLNRPYVSEVEDDFESEVQNKASEQVMPRVLDAGSKPVQAEESSTPQGGSDAEAEASSDDEELEENEYVVERVTGRRLRSGRVQYKVRWKGYEDETWEPAANLVKAADAVKAYEQQQSEAQALERVAAAMRVDNRICSTDDDDDIVSPAARMVLGTVMSCRRL